MNPIVRNILAIAAGFAAGMALNMGIIEISPWIIPPPEGADMLSPEGINAAMPLLKPEHFLMPFLAHVSGTFAGAFLASLLAATNKMRIAIGFGILNLVGGVAAATMIPAPTWFIATDLVLAYLPVAYFAGRLNTARG